MKKTKLRQYNDATDKLNFDYKYNPAETPALKKAAKRNASVDIDLLRRIALWKLDRVLNVPGGTVQKLQALAADGDLRVDSAETQSLIAELMECEGIGLPMASTILTFLRPDVFPIIDVRAYRALYGKKRYFSQSKDQKNIELYLAYAADVRGISQKLNRPLRDIDEQLYEFDKQHNGKI
jgi:hypothetical protein